MCMLYYSNSLTGCYLYIMYLLLRCILDKTCVVFDGTLLLFILVTISNDVPDSLG